MTPITVSIVSFNTCELLRACLTSLEARRDEAAIEIFVVDNGSRDGSPQMVKNEFPAVKLLEVGRNLGYGRANNLALERASGDFFWILNSDTEIYAGTISKMLDFLARHPACGAVATRLIMPDGQTQPSCARDPNLLDYFWEQTYLSHTYLVKRFYGIYTYDAPFYLETREIAQAAGASIFCRSGALNGIGGFDPRYFMYFEDTDLCLRLRGAGWKLFYLHDAPVAHHVGASSESDWRTRAAMVSALNASRYLYFKAHHGALKAEVLRWICVLGAVLHMGAWLFQMARTRDLKKWSKVRLFVRVLRNTLAITPERARKGF
jgi:hypothetical protein